MSFWQDMGDFVGWGSARRNREFQAEMSNTAYQRSVADMKKAGLNPALTMSQGSASTPSGSEPPSGSALSGAINSAANMIATAKQGGDNGYKDKDIINTALTIIKSMM